MRRALRKRILIVHDDGATAEALDAALRRVGLEPRRPAPGRQLADELRASTADLVLMSARLPHAAEQLRSVRSSPSGRSIPLLFLGSGDPSDFVASPSDALAKGGDYFFKLPANFDHLARRVDGWLRSPDSADAHLADEPTRDSLDADVLSADGLDDPTLGGAPATMAPTIPPRPAGRPEEPTDAQHILRPHRSPRERIQPPDLAAGSKSAGGRALVDDARELELAGQVRDAVEAYATAATLFQVDGELERAIRTYRHALSLEPHRADIAEATAELLVGERRKTEALELLSESLAALEVAGRSEPATRLRRMLQELRPAIPADPTDPRPPPRSGSQAPTEAPPVGEDDAGTELPEIGEPEFAMPSGASRGSGSPSRFAEAAIARIQLESAPADPPDGAQPVDTSDLAFDEAEEGGAAEPEAEAASESRPESRAEPASKRESPAETASAGQLERSTGTAKRLARLPPLGTREASWTPLPGPPLTSLEHLDTSWRPPEEADAEDSHDVSAFSFDSDVSSPLEEPWSTLAASSGVERAPEARVGPPSPTESETPTGAGQPAGPTPSPVRPIATPWGLDEARGAADHSTRRSDVPSDPSVESGEPAFSRPESPGFGSASPAPEAPPRARRKAARGQPFDAWVQTEGRSSLPPLPQPPPIPDALTPWTDRMPAPAEAEAWNPLLGSEVQLQATPRSVAAPRLLEPPAGRIEGPADAVDLLVTLENRAGTGILRVEGASPIVFVDGVPRDLRGRGAVDRARQNWSSAPPEALDEDAGLRGLQRELRQRRKAWGLTEREVELAASQEVDAALVELFGTRAAWRFEAAEPEVILEDLGEAGLPTSDRLVGWVAQVLSTSELWRAAGGDRARLKISAGARSPRPADLRRFFQAIDGRRTLEDARRHASVAKARAAAQAAVWVWSGQAGPSRRISVPPEPVANRRPEAPDGASRRAMGWGYGPMVWYVWPGSPPGPWVAEPPERVPDSGTVPHPELGSLIPRERIRHLREVAERGDPHALLDVPQAVEAERVFANHAYLIGTVGEAAAAEGPASRRDAHALLQALDRAAEALTGAVEIAERESEPDRAG